MKTVVVSEHEGVITPTQLYTKLEKMSKDFVIDCELVDVSLSAERATVYVLIKKQLELVHLVNALGFVFDCYITGNTHAMYCKVKGCKDYEYKKN